MKKMTTKQSIKIKYVDQIYVRLLKVLNYILYLCEFTVNYLFIPGLHLMKKIDVRYVALRHEEDKCRVI